MFGKWFVEKATLKWGVILIVDLYISRIMIESCPVISFNIASSRDTPLFVSLTMTICASFACTNEGLGRPSSRFLNKASPDKGLTYSPNIFCNKWKRTPLPLDPFP